MKNSFDKFVAFGKIADSVKRKKLADGIFRVLTEQANQAVIFANSETDNFATAIQAILSNGTMKELCNSDQVLAEEITQEVLEFINSAKKRLIKTDSPFETEHELLQTISTSDKHNFLSNWKAADKHIRESYSQRELDSVFYEKEFKKCLSNDIAEETGAPHFESVKEHFIERWTELLFMKQTKWELELIDELRQTFCKNLYKRIEELKYLQEVLKPFTSELGRIWDMSKGNWQRGNFETLKHYADLLKKDTSLKDLAEMLGRMRHAEKRYEEEIFSSIVIKPEWKVEHASKSDLIGVRESDDLSSLLPSETALLADDTMQAVFFKKFVEKKLQTFEYQAKFLSFKKEEIQDKRQQEINEAKGPFIICVDTSGSMHGTPETVAKTLCFAILKIAVRESRKCYLISFSTGLQTLELSDLRNSLDKIMDFLSMSFHGGTDAAPAMQEALRLLTTNDYKKADIVVASDFVMPAFDSHTKQLIGKAKENKTKFHSIVIGNCQNSASIADFDNNWVYDTNNPESVLRLLKSLSEI